MTTAVEKRAAILGCLTTFSTREWSGKNRVACVSAQVIAPRNGHAMSTQSKMPSMLATARMERTMLLLRGDSVFHCILSAHNQIEKRQPDAGD